MRHYEVNVNWLTGNSVENEVEWLLRCRVWLARPATFNDPPEDGDCSILLATCSTRSLDGDEWIDEHDISDDDLLKIQALAEDAVADSIICHIEGRAEARRAAREDR